MRSKGRSRGRFVSLSGLQKLAGLPGSQFPVIIVDSTGLPVFFLSEWYRRKKTLDPGRTPDTYLDMLLPWAGYLLQQGHVWNDAPDRIRAHLVEFLRMNVGCQVSPGQEEGYLLETTGTSPLSKSSLGVLLAAITSQYDVMIGGGYYAYANPMRSEHLALLKRDHLQHVKNAGAPDHAGIRGESHQATNQAYPTAFFRQKRGRVWEPSVVLEPDEVQERVRATLDFMIAHATFQRDQVVLLLLRQTGARLNTNYRLWEVTGERSTLARHLSETKEVGGGRKKRSTSLLSLNSNFANTSRANEQHMIPKGGRSSMNWMTRTLCS